jgi:tetratricopeptide (TPR) repeat protein
MLTCKDATSTIGIPGKIPKKRSLIFNVRFKSIRNSVARGLGFQPRIVLKQITAAYARRGGIKSAYDWDWTGADADYKRALQLDPPNVDAVNGAGDLAFTLGRFDESIRLYRRAIELDPLRLVSYSNLGVTYYCAGRLQDAEAALRKALEINPQYPYTHYSLGRIWLAQSKIDQAFAELQKESDPFWRRFGFALAYHAAGKKKEADAAFAEVIKQDQNNSAFQIAELYAFRGETEKAFESLDRAYKLRDSGLAEMIGDPLLRNIEKDPRYRLFLQKMKLPVD